MEQYAIRVIDAYGTRFVWLDDDGYLEFTSAHEGHAGLARAWLGEYTDMVEEVQRFIRGEVAYSEKPETAIVEIISVKMSVQGGEVQNMNPQYPGMFILRDKHDPIRFYTGTVDNIWDFEIHPKIVNIHAATKFESLEQAELALGEMNELERSMKITVYDFTCRNYEIIKL